VADPREGVLAQEGGEGLPQHHQPPPATSNQQEEEEREM
jgi:hypothetical protein